MKLNRVTIGGRLGADPELKTGNVVSLALATDDGYKDKDGNKVERTNWHRVACFGKLGETIKKFCKKGDQIIIHGRIEYKQHEEKWYTSIIAQDFTFVSSPKRDEGEYHNNPDPIPAHIGEDDDLPF